MPVSLPPHFVELVYDALLQSFWRKRALRHFLRRSHIAEPVLAQLSDEETKREWLDRLFPKLEASDRGQAIIQEMARSLAEQTSFPDLVTSEDSAAKVAAAKAAVQALRDYMSLKERQRQEEQERQETRSRAAEARANYLRSQHDLSILQERLNSLCSDLGTQAGGYAFQEWFFDLAAFSEIDSRRPYVTAGRQIDGSITIDGTTYLIELKFTQGQASATDIDSLLAKVNTKADNTMGIMISMSGYTSTAISAASFARTPLLLFEYTHLYHVLAGIESLQDVVRRVRRHCSQTGEAFLRTTDFGGPNG